MEQNKKVPSIRFKGFENEWSLVKLGEISSTFTDGDWIESKDQSFYGIRLVQTGNIGVNRFISKENSSKWISNETFNNLKCKEIFEGDILISRLPEPAGRSTILPKLKTKAITSVDCTVVRLKDEYINTFINQFLSSQNYFKTVNNLLAGGTRQRISRSNLYQIDLFSPSKFEQTQIGDFFKTLDSQINAQEQKHQKLINLKKAMLEKMFPKEGADVPEIRFKGFTEKWEPFYIKDICSISTGKSNTQDKIDNGIYPFYVRSATIERSNRYLYNEEAVLTVGDGVGTGKVFHYVNGKFDLHQRVYRMYNFNNIKGKFFYYIFSKEFYKRVMSMTAKTSVDSVRLEMIADMSILIPTNEEQIMIIDFLENYDNQINNIEAKIEKHKNIKQALLQKMFV